jgi:hypothetical protein
MCRETKVCGRSASQSNTLPRQPRSKATGLPHVTAAILRCNVLRCAATYCNLATCCVTTQHNLLQPQPVATAARCNRSPLPRSPYTAWHVATPHDKLQHGARSTFVAPCALERIAAKTSASTALQCGHKGEITWLVRCVRKCVRARECARWVAQSHEKCVRFVCSSVGMRAPE